VVGAAIKAAKIAPARSKTMMEVHDPLRDMKGIAGLVEAVVPKPKQREPYKKQISN
jgi:hypothetical protein